MRKPILKTDRTHTRAATVVHMFKTVQADYAFQDDILSEDTPRVAALKRIISGLDQVDKTIIILYMELQSTRELGRILNVSKRTAARTVARIKSDIVEKYNKLSA